ALIIVQRGIDVDKLKVFELFIRVLFQAVQASNSAGINRQFQLGWPLHIRQVEPRYQIRAFQVLLSWHIPSVGRLTGIIGSEFEPNSMINQLMNELAAAPQR